MPGSEPRGPRPSTIAIVVVYALVLSAGSFLHHDFACHQNSRTHCTFCLTNQSAQKVEISGPPLDAIDRLVGRVELQAATADERTFLSSLSDRAPPA
jgi:hypothetical protein